MSDASILAATRDSYDAIAVEYADMLSSDLDGRPLDRALGDEQSHRAEAFGKPIALDFYRQRPDEVSQLLRDAGFDPWATVVKEAEGTEKTPQGFVIARKPSSST